MNIKRISKNLRTPRGDEARTRRSKDGTWAKKGAKSYFGYKLHTKLDLDYGLIREFETTTASVHDSQVDLSTEGEVVSRDKGYQGAEANGYAATLKRAARGHPLSQHLGSVAKSTDREETGAGRAAVCRDQARLQGWTCPRHHRETGEDQDALHRFWIQPLPGLHPPEARSHSGLA